MQLKKQMCLINKIFSLQYTPSVHIGGITEAKKRQERNLEGIRELKRRREMDSSSCKYNEGIACNGGNCAACGMNPNNTGLQLRRIRRSQIENRAVKELREERIELRQDKLEEAVTMVISRLAVPDTVAKEQCSKLTADCVKAMEKILRKNKIKICNPFTNKDGNPCFMSKKRCANCNVLKDRVNMIEEKKFNLYA